MINTKKYIVLTMVAVLVFFTGCKDKNTQVSLTDKAENNSQTTRAEAGENSEEPSESLKEIYVYVSGQVNNPGVYCLKSNDRVFMAIEKAGGLTKKAQKQGVNMAEVLKDGQNIVVLSQKEYYAKLKENENGSEKNLDGNSDSGFPGKDEEHRHHADCGAPPEHHPARRQYHPVVPWPDSGAGDTPGASAPEGALLSAVYPPVPKAAAVEYLINEITKKSSAADFFQALLFWRCKERGRAL